MKPLVGVCFFLLFTVQTFAEFSLGITLSSRLNNNHLQMGKDLDRNTVSYDLNLGPEFLITIAERVEISPFFHVMHSRSSTYINDDLQTLNRLWGFDYGVGTYFRLINGDIFRFSTGPKVMASMQFDPETTDESTFSWYLTAPANIDFRLSDRFFIRTSPTIAGLGYTLETTGSEDQYTGRFSFTVITQSTITIGFYFTF